MIRLRLKCWAWDIGRTLTRRHPRTWGTLTRSWTPTPHTTPANTPPAQAPATPDWHHRLAP